MFIQNNYSLNLMNGTEGIIVDVNIQENHISVRFNNNIYKFLTYRQSEETEEITSQKKQLNTDSLILSYCVTVHRYQGSEINYVIGYIPEGKPSSSFLNANLLYTLITRSKKNIWLIGDVPTIKRCATTPIPWRCNNLGKRL
jgi:exodeoxyribonuclease V alpha subunit